MTSFMRCQVLYNVIAPYPIMTFQEGSMHVSSNSLLKLSGGAKNKGRPGGGQSFARCDRGPRALCLALIPRRNGDLVGWDVHSSFIKTHVDIRSPIKNMTRSLK